MTDHGIQRRLVVALTVPLALMLVMLALLAVLVMRLSTVTRQIADIEASISIANNLEKLIVDAETGFRAFLLVAGDDFLEPTNSADTQLPIRFAELRATVAGDPAQLARLDRVETRLRTWRNLVDQAIRAKRSGGDYLTLIASRQPKRQVDEMRAEVAAFVAQQRGVRDSRSVAAAAFTRGVVAAIGAGAVLVAVTMWLVTWREVAHSSTTYAQALETTRRSRDELKAAAETLETRVAERTQLLTAANEELEALSYSVSHDLRAPIRHVSGFAELLKQQTSATSDPKVRHYVDRILRRTDEAGELIDQLLTFSRTGRVPMEFGEVATDAIVRDIIDSLPDTQQRRIEWTIGQLPVVRGDRRLLTQVFANLIGNAVKYTRGRQVARITITCERRSDEDVFTISDNGAGFDQRYADKLFTVFQRLHTAEEFEGTGVGLALVRRIALRHGGRTWASGEVDKGASISFTLSRRPAAAATSENAA